MVEKFQRDITDLFNYPSDENPTTQADYISAVKNWQETERNIVDSVLWQPDTDYAIGAVVKTPSIPSQYILVCTQEGTSGTEEPDYTDVSTGYSVSDGTAIWRVETIVSLDKVNDMFTNIIELIESGEALTGDMWSLDIEENMIANKDNIVPKTNGVSKLGTAEKRWGEIHVVTPTKGDNSEKVATTAYVQAELQDYVTLNNLETELQDYVTLNNLETELQDYLPLSGGTMTGTIIAGFPAMLAPTNAGTVTIAGGAGTGSADGAKLILNGAEREAGPGEFTVQAGKSGGYKQFIGKPNGTLTWGGKNVLTDETVGTILEASTSADVSLSASAAKNITSLSVPRGTWIITGHARFDNVTSGKAYGAMFGGASASYNSNNDSAIYVHSSSTTPISIQTTRIIVQNANSTVYFVGYANAACKVLSGATFRAIRIL